MYSREIAPLAGFYPSVYVGAPWWFIDDTRAFTSIPARHEASRRTEASFLVKLLAEHRITGDRAHEIIVDAAPRRAFKL